MVSATMLHTSSPSERPGEASSLKDWESKKQQHVTMKFVTYRKGTDANRDTKRKQYDETIDFPKILEFENISQFQTIHLQWRV